MLPTFKTMLTNRRGSQFVEASVAVPIAILAVLLLVRIFVFYLEILNMGVKEHEKFFAEWDAYGEGIYHKYEEKASVSMLGGGLLGIDLKNTLEIEANLYNEDKIVRSRIIAEAVKK